MRIDRAERTGFGASIAGHVLLFGLLVAGYFTVRPIEPPKRESIEVDLIAETALESGAPEISQEAPAPKFSEIEAPIEPEPLAKPVIEPVPAPVAKPVPVPKPVARQPAKPPAKAPARPAPRPRKLPIDLSDLPVEGDGRATAQRAATITPQVQSSLGREIIRQIRPHWTGPTGPDVDALKTVLRVSLARDGSVTNVEFVGTSGTNASNRTIAPIHKERAIKAVKLASPFQLPAQFYEGWKTVNVNFDWSLR